MEVAGIQYNIRYHIEVLQRLDLVDVKEDGYPRRKVITLTEKGMRVAKLLYEIESLLKSPCATPPTPCSSRGGGP